MRIRAKDSLVIYGFVMLSVTLPLLIPVGFGLSVGKETRRAFDQLEALDSTSIVLISPNFSPSSEAEMLPALNALVEHLIRKNVKMVWLSLDVEGIMYAQRASQTLESAGYVYGGDYIILPYLPGKDTAVASLASNFTSTCSRDYAGRKLSDYDLGRKLSSITDFSMAIDFNTGDTTIYYIQHFAGLKVKVISAASGVTVPYLMPYLSSGQLSGLLGGLRGAAEYEKLLGRRGIASRSMDAQAMAHLCVMTGIVAGNIQYAASRRKGGINK